MEGGSQCGGWAKEGQADLPGVVVRGRGGYMKVHTGGGASGSARSRGFLGCTGRSRNCIFFFFFFFFFFFSRATDQQYGIRTFEDNSKLHGHTNEHVQLIRGTSRD